MKYNIISHSIKVDDISTTLYGISVLQNDLLIYLFEDISADYVAIQKFVIILNEEKPELIHINDIIEDFCIEHSYFV